MIKKTNIIRALVVTFAIVMTLCGYAEGNRLSTYDQARVRNLVNYLNVNNDNDANSQDVMVRALAKMNEEAVPVLEKMGVQVTRLQGEIYSIYFNISQLREIRKVEGVKQVDVSRDMRPVGDPPIKKGEPRLIVRPV